MNANMNQKTERVTIIGAGRLGMVLAQSIRDTGCTISAIIDLDVKRAINCQTLVNAEIGGNNLESIPPETTIIFIAVPDAAIQSVADTLAQTSTIQAGTVVCHTSGLTTADVLKPIQREGILLNSCHPCCTFSHGDNGDMTNVHFALEGSQEGCERLARFIGNLGGHPFIIGKEAKAAYHTACVMASNYLLTLIDSAEKILTKSGVQNGKSILGPLIERSVQNVLRMNSADALTGPIVRGDVQTVESHVETLSGMDSRIMAIYKSLGLMSLEIAKQAGLSHDKIESLSTLLKNIGDGTRDDD